MKKVMLTRPAYAGQGFARPRVVVAEKNQENESQGYTTPPPLPLGRGKGGVYPTAEEGKNEVSELLSLAHKLSPTQRQELLDHLALSAQTPHRADAGQDRDVEMWSQALARGLQHALGASDGVPGGSMLFRRLVAPATAWKPIADFLTTSKIGDLTVAERQAAFDLLAELVVTQALKIARRSGAPISPKFVVNCTSNIAGVFDSAFPGYLEAGLAHIVARRARHGDRHASV